MTAAANRSAWKFATVSALLMLSSGCSSSNISEAEGTVTCQGKPLLYGALIFVGPDGMTKSANIDTTTGRYHIREVGSGLVKIAVVSYDPAAPMDQEFPANPNDPKKANWAWPQLDRSKWIQTPKKYEMIHTSGLQVELKPGMNSNIDLQLE